MNPPISKEELNGLSGQLEQGEVLIIVPPLAQTDYPSLAAHLLQACCDPLGISVRVLYANIQLANILGLNFHRTIIDLNMTTFIGERLFARSAFELPPMGRNIHRLADPGWLPDHLWQRKNEIAAQKMSKNLAPIRDWVLSVDWLNVERQVVQWTESTAKGISRMGYRVVGYSNSLGGLVPGFSLLNLIKKMNPGIITVLGGALCEGEMAEGILALNRGIDYVFSGESENTFPDFIKDILIGKPPKENVINGKEINNLNEIPLPDYRDYFQQAEAAHLKIPSAKRIHLPYETSRGCPWKKCKFCGLNGEEESYRIKSPETVIHDLEQFVNRYTEIFIHMTDKSMPLQYINNLFPQISVTFPSIRIEYAAGSKLTLNQVIALKEAGVFIIHAGIESMSSSLLKSMRKNVTARQNIELMRYARSVGVNLRWNLLFGIPGDNVGEYEEMLELLPIIHHLPPPERMAPIVISRFSLYHKAPHELGITNLRPAEFYKDILPGNTNLEKIAFYFAGEFNAQSYEHPDILAALREEFQAWISAWQPNKTEQATFAPPKLHIEERNHGQFELHDTRNLPGNPERMIVDREKARILLAATPWDDSPPLRWAVEAKLGVVRESWFIPLATADPELLQEFERDFGNKC